MSQKYKQGIDGDSSDGLVDCSSDKAEYFYWNVFPVDQDSLAAYVTTYCYFDQDGSQSPELTAVGKANLPMINAMSVPVTQNYAPQEKFREYKERLNDPTMKYNELW